MKIHSFTCIEILTALYNYSEHNDNTKKWNQKDFGRLDYCHKLQLFDRNTIVVKVTNTSEWMEFCSRPSSRSPSRILSTRAPLWKSSPSHRTLSSEKYSLPKLSWWSFLTFSLLSLFWCDKWRILWWTLLNIRTRILWIQFEVEYRKNGLCSTSAKNTHFTLSHKVSYS